MDELGVVESFVIGLSSQRMCRDLFWLFSQLGLLLLLVFVVLLAIPRHRRVAAIGLPVCAVGAILFRPIWYIVWRNARVTSSSLASKV
jgi:presenilin-like A22 family membrane protease